MVSCGLLCVLLGAESAIVGTATYGLGERCGGTCPCEKAEAVECEADLEAHDNGLCSGAGHGDPCPPDCTGCSCCPAVVVAVVPNLLDVVQASLGERSPLAPLDRPAAGAVTRVFRPPRSALS